MRTVTDKDVAQHIALLHKLAGSADVKEMIRADIKYCDNAYAWHRRTRAIFERLGAWYVTGAAGVASGLGLHYWIADNFGPMAAGATVIIGLPLAFCGFLWLCSR